MNGLKTTKYMRIFTTLGYIIGFLIIIWCSLFSDNKLYVIVGLVVIFIGRFLGYGIDRIIELKEDKQK